MVNEAKLRRTLVI